VSSKVCYKCNVCKPITEFFRDKSRSDGYCYRCKSCAKDSLREYCDNNRELVNKKSLAYYHSQTQEYRDRMCKRISIDYGADNPEVTITKLKRIHNGALRRCEDKNTDIDLDWLKNLYDKTKTCPECDVVMTPNGNGDTGKTLDHLVPLGIGGKHIQFNVRVVCRKCNLTRPRGGSDIRAGKILVVWSETVTI